ncbi:putative non-specific lipid-transfer protein 14 isoform X2 [Raphanus sativus]|uniref:Non-specific lipid-transfer protein 14 isoform X2 n=1 Tax=Raphanus sativus TaxID=3726 RepID=A0A9W3CMV0_RAPSA|nr:putative non-specific lipid-transfer protein 14 isoform X2 [Raphanus sativus]
MKRLFSPVVLVSLFLSLSSAICSATVENAADCVAVGTLISSCTEFVNYGYPDPVPGSSCCDAMTVLGTYSDSSDKRRWLCNCFIDLISVYNSNATAISTLSGFCGIVLGFTIDPNTDCNFIQ